MSNTFRGLISRLLAKTRRPRNEFLPIVLQIIFCSFLTAGGAHAQLVGGDLNESNYAFGGSSLRDNVSSVQVGPQASTIRPWTFNGDVDVEAGATDLTGTGGNAKWQPIILISPDFILNGITSRLSVSLIYSPRLAFYPSSPNQTLLSQTFNGFAGLTVIPDLFFLDVRGISGLSSRFGNTSLVSASVLNRSEAVQSTSFSISPYFRRVFAGYGIAIAGYSHSQTYQDSGSNSASFYYAPNSAQTAGYGTLGSLQTDSEFASFTTGENFGRLQDSISASANQLSGSYFYQGASKSSITNRLSYSVYRWLTPFVTVGYESYNYPRSNYRLDEPTWTVGVTISPNQVSSLTIQYGRVAGGNTVLVNGFYSPTDRSRVFGSYTVDIQTGIGARQALLGTTNVGPGGILLNNLTNSPTLANSYLASQYPLSRVKTATIGGSLLLYRDTLTATVAHSEFEQLGGSVSILGITTQPGTATNTTYGTLNWQHDLSPSTSLSSGVSYATSDNGIFYGVPGTSQDTLELYSSLNHVFTDTLSGSLSYNHIQRFGSAARNLPSNFGGSVSQNTLLIGLRKSF